MKPDECRGELVSRKRRGVASAGDLAALAHHVTSCSACRVADQIGHDFDSDAQALPGDDALVARFANQAMRAVAKKPAPPRRLPWRGLQVAAAFGLVSLGAAALWLPSKPSRSEPPTEVPRPQPRPSARAVSAVSALATESPPPPEAKLSPPASNAASYAPAPDPETAASLFAKANDARRTGDGPRARGLYEQLQRRFPSSAEVQLSRVSLGRLLLEAGSAAPALAQFDRYLASDSGGLRAEALFGRARALAMLGRSAEERATWDQLLREFPSSVYAGKARARLAEPR